MRRVTAFGNEEALATLHSTVQQQKVVKSNCERNL